MKTIVISNQKGGVGKSTIAVFLSMAIEEKNKRILFIDIDPQANASKTLKLNKSTSVSSVVASDLYSKELTLTSLEKPITLVSSDIKMTDIERANPSVLQTLKDNIDRASEHFDYCIIDSPPTLGLRMTGALIVADYVLSPIELEEYAIDGITQMLKTIFGVQSKYNKKLKFLGMLPNRFNPRSIRQKATLTQLIQRHSDLLIKTPIGIRSSIPEALSQGLPVWKLKKTAAKIAGKELEVAFKLIFEKVEGLHND